MTLSCNFKCNVLILEIVVGEMPSEYNQNDCNLEGEQFRNVYVSLGRAGRKRRGNSVSLRSGMPAN